MSALDQEVRGRQVGERLGDLVAGLEVAPADWSGVRLGVVRARRRRRALLAAKVAGGTLAVAALLGTLQAGLAALPGVGARGAGVAGPRRRSELADRPAQGSLAADDAWLDGFRRHVVAQHQPESGGEDWRGAERARRGRALRRRRRRLAARPGEAPYRWGVVEEQRQVWFQGPGGGAAEQMVLVDQQPPADVALVAFWPVGEGDGPLGLVVVAVGDREVTVDGWAQLRSDGTVADDSTTLGTGPDGLLEWVAPGAGPYDVVVDGLPPRVLGEQTAQVPTGDLERQRGARRRRGGEERGPGGRHRPGADDRSGGTALGRRRRARLAGRGVGAGTQRRGPARGGSGGAARPVAHRRARPTRRLMTVDLRAGAAGRDEEPVVAWQVGETAWSHAAGHRRDPGGATPTRRGTRGRAPPRRSPSSARRPPCRAERPGPRGDGAALGGAGRRGQGWPARTVRERVSFVDADGAEVGSADVVPWAEANATAVPGS